MVTNSNVKLITTIFICWLASSSKEIIELSNKTVGIRFQSVFLDSTITRFWQSKLIIEEIGTIISITWIRS